MSKKKKSEDVFDVSFSTLADYIKEEGKLQWLSTGLANVDNIMGGGMPMGRMIEIFGAESSGKTTFALHLMKKIQDAGGNFLYIDSERAISMDRVVNGVGIDPDRCYYHEVNKMEDIFDLIVNFCESAATLGSDGVPRGIIWDSVAASSPLEELESDWGDKQYAPQARLLSKALRTRVISAISQAKVFAIFVNQVRDDISPSFFKTYVVPGGRAIKFYASIRILMSRGGFVGKTVKKVPRNLAIVSKMSIIKNKLAPEKGMTYVPIYFGGTCIREAESVLYSLHKEKKLDKANGKYSYTDSSTGKVVKFGKKDFPEHRDVLLAMFPNLLEDFDE